MRIWITRAGEVRGGLALGWKVNVNIVATARIDGEWIRRPARSDVGCEARLFSRAALLSRDGTILRGEPSLSRTFQGGNHVRYKIWYFMSGDSSPSPPGRRCREAADEGRCGSPHRRVRRRGFPFVAPRDCSGMHRDVSAANVPHPAFGHLLPGGEGIKRPAQLYNPRNTTRGSAITMSGRVSNPRVGAVRDRAMSS